MAETKGLVQQLKIYSGGATWLYIGPAPTNTAVFFISRAAGDSAVLASVKDDMVAAASAAMVARREIVAVHDAASSEVTMLRIDP